MAKLNKERLIFGVFLLILIVIAEIILEHFHLATWPAFMVMIFFFEAHMDIKKAPNIIVGGLFGMICTLVLVKFWSPAVVPLVGPEVSKLVYICLAVYAIVAFGEIVPIVFNNYAFMYFMISGLAFKLEYALVPQGGAVPNPLSWMAIEVVGGLVFIAGIIGIFKLMGAIMPNQEAAA